MMLLRLPRNDLINLSVKVPFDMTTTRQQFEAAIAQLTQPLNGQFPRPWMTDLTDPVTASLFIVGRNQAKGYGVDRLTHQRHMDALFNRSGESCRGLYLEMSGGNSSPTRVNTDRFRNTLFEAGVEKILETNVECYSTPMSSDLRMPEHKGGAVRGTDIFCSLLHFVKPKILIAHGAGTKEILSRLLGTSLPALPTEFSEPQATDINGMKVFIIPSLAPPAWNKWSSWGAAYLKKVAKSAAVEL